MSVNQELAALVQRLEAVATRLEKQPGSSNQIIEGKFLNNNGRAELGQLELTLYS